MNLSNATPYTPETATGGRACELIRLASCSMSNSYFHSLLECIESSGHGYELTESKANLRKEYTANLCPQASMLPRTLSLEISTAALHRRRRNVFVKFIQWSIKLYSVNFVSSGPGLVQNIYHEEANERSDNLVLVHDSSNLYFNAQAI